jgi:hypothetical protein
MMLAIDGKGKHLKAPKTDAQRLVNDSTYSVSKIDKVEYTESVERYEAIRASVAKLIEEMGSK